MSHLFKGIALVALFATAAFAALPQLNHTTALQSCPCGDGNNDLFDHETIVESWNPPGSFCPGICYGTPFIAHKKGVWIKTFEIWTSCADSNGACAVKITFSDGSNPLVFGTMYGPYRYEFNFKAGEAITKLFMFMSDNGQRIGGVRFETNIGSVFAAGNLNNPPVEFNINNRILSGIVGHANPDLFQLGFIFYKPIASAKLLHVEYPFLDTITSGLSPKLLTSLQGCNDFPNDQKLPSRKVTTQTGSKSCWSRSSTFSFEMSVSVEAGLPGVVSVSEGYKWSIGVTQSQEECRDTTSTEEDTYEFSAPARAFYDIQLTQWASPITTPYTADYRLTFVDGTFVDFPTSGVYSGMYVSKYITNFHRQPLKQGQHCPPSEFIAVQ